MSGIAPEDERELAALILRTRNEHKDADANAQLEAIVAATGRSLSDLEAIAAESPKVRMAIGKLVKWPKHRMPGPLEQRIRAEIRSSRKRVTTSKSKDISARWYPKPVRLGLYRNAGKRIEAESIRTCSSCGRPIRANDRCGC